MNRKNKIKAIVALAVALAFVMPGAVAFANVGTVDVTFNSENTGDMENGDMENIVGISTNGDTSDNAENTVSVIMDASDNLDETEESNTLSIYPDALLMEGGGQIPDGTRYLGNDVGVESINYPVDGGIYPIGEYVVNATVKNYGDNNQSSFSARMEVKKVIPEYEINVFFDDMESGSDKWIIVDGNKDNDMWTIKTDKYHSSTHSWKCTAGSRYHADANDDLITSILNLSDAKSATLGFWHWCNGEPGFDYGGVYLSCDNGMTWKEAMSGIYSTGWEEVEINIGDYISLTDEVLIKFNWVSDPLWQNYGWYIDDVCVNKMIPEKYITIKTDSKEVKDLHSGGSRDVLFEPWSVCEEADYVILVKTLLSNDENLGNDGKEIRISIGDVLDVEVTSASCPREIEYGNILPINATVHNSGNLDTGSFEVTCGIYKYMQEKTEIFKEGFEKHWVPDSNGDLAPPGWEVRKHNDWIGPWPAYWHQNPNAHSGSYCAAVWYEGDFSPSNEWLITPEIDLRSAMDIELKFWTYTEGTEIDDIPVMDHNYVQVSTDGGQHWDNEWDRTEPNYYDHEVTLDLSKYSGEKIKIAFNRYWSGGGYGYVTIWMVDDISIYARVPHSEPVWEESKNISTMEPGDTTDLEWIWHPDYCCANIKITTELEGDMKEENDQGIITVTRIIKTWYTNDIESGKLGWEGIDLSPFHPSNWHIISGDGSHYFWCGDEKIEVKGYKGGYGPNWNDGLYIKGPLDLSLTNSARLKFKTWYYISDGRGYVEVSRDNSTWETIASYHRSSSWVEKTLNLSDYTNETVYIRFRFESYHSSGIKGWFIDDVKVEQLVDGNVTATPFEDDMESGDGKWIKKWIPGAQLWHMIDKNHHKSVSHCHSPTHSWVCMDEDFNGYYGYMDDALTSPEFNLSQSFGAYVGFCCAYSIMNSLGWEATGYFEVTNNGGKTWNEVGKFEGTKHYLSDKFSWGYHEFDISEYLPGIIQVRFRLESDYRSFNYYDPGMPGHPVYWGGWYVDDVGIKAMFDEESPETKCYLTGDLGEDDWYISPVTVTLEATDEGSGVDYTMYKLDDDVDWRKYTGSFPVPEDDDVHTLQYFSVDYVGNEEDPCDVEFKIDQTPPTIKLTWNKDDSKLVADVDDETSGINRVEFSVNGEYVGTATKYPYEWIISDPKRGDKGQATVYDNASNKEVSEEIDAVPQSQSQSNSNLVPVQRRISWICLGGLTGIQNTQRRV